MRKFFVIGKGSGSGPAPEPQPFPTTPEDNQVFYKSMSGSAINGWNSAFMDAYGDPMTIESNVYQDGYGILTFADDVKGMGIRNSSRYILPSGPDVLLTDILMPDCVEYLGQNLFNAFPNFKSVNIPASCTAIYNSCFANNTSLVCDIVLPEGMTTMGTGVFNKSGIKSCNWPTSLTTIPQSTFDQCPNLTSFNIPATATTIDNYAFRGCYNLTSMTIDPSNPNYSSGTNNDAVYMGTTLLFGFRNTVIEEGTTEIYNYAFYKQYGLASIVIPSTITTIGTYAFNNCSSLTAIDSLPTTAPTISSNTFQSVGENGVLTVHNADYSTWMSTGNYYLGKYNWTCEGMAYAVSISAGSNGSVSVDDVPGDFNDMVPIGTQLTLLATPDQDYVFDTWSDGDNSNPKSAVVDSPITLTASFTPDVVYHTVTVLANANADISVDGTQISGDTQFTVAEGQQMVFSISAHSGWYFSATMFSDGTETDYNNPSTYTLGQSDVTVSFDIQHFRTITLVTNDSSMGLVGFSGETPAATTTKTGVYDGSCEDMYAYPETDYTFVRWESNDITIDSPTDNPSYSCGGSGTITAVFQAAAPQQPNDEIWYTTSNSQTVAPYALKGVNNNTLTVASNTYSGGKGVMKMSGDIYGTANSFASQSTLTSISLPSTLTNLGNGCFVSCTNLSSITFTSTTTVPTLGTNVFNNVSSTGTVYGQSGLDFSTVMAALPSGWTLVQ